MAYCTIRFLLLLNINFSLKSCLQLELKNSQVSQRVLKVRQHLYLQYVDVADALAMSSQQLVMNLGH